MLIFHAVALLKAKDNYSSKLASKHATNQALFSLGWKVNELSRLTELGRDVRVRSKTILDRLMNAECNLVQENILKQLADL